MKDIIKDFKTTIKSMAIGESLEIVFKNGDTMSLSKNGDLIIESKL